MNARKWQRSSYCDTGSCIEMTTRIIDGTTWNVLRNSIFPEHEVLLSPAEFAVFLDGVDDGEFDGYLPPAG